MSALDDLRSARYRRIESDYYSERLVRLQSAAEGLNAQLATGDVDIWNLPHSMQSLADTIMDLGARVSLSIVECEQHTVRAEKALDGLTEPQRMIMRLRFVRAMRWEQVADEMHLSVRQCHRIYDSAVKKLSRT